MVVVLPLPLAGHHSGATTNPVPSQQQQHQQQQHDDDDDDVDKEKKKDTNNDCNNDCSNNGSSIVIHKTRVRDALGYVGTVVYIGPVASAKDESMMYAGIVWDDTSRGKHDGTVVCRRTKRLVRHFDCRRYYSDSGHSHATTTTTAASFIKLSKLDTGRLLTPSLVQERYVPLDSDECVAPNELLPHQAQTASGRNDKPIQFLGELQIRKHLQVQQLHHLSLRRLGICGIQVTRGGQEDDVVLDWSSLFFHKEKNDNDDNVAAVVILTHLDLAGNLLSDWQSVGEILNVTALAEALDTLNLSWNRLGDLPLSSSLSSNPSSLRFLATNTTLTTINLQACHIQNLTTLIHLGQSWTQLQELGLAKCNFANVCCKINNNNKQKQNKQQQSLTTNTTSTSSLSPSSSPPPRVMNESQQETCTISGNDKDKDNMLDCSHGDNINNNHHDDDDYNIRIVIDMDMVHLHQQQLARHLAHIRRLDLSSCQLHSPYQVVVFAHLPVLESFSLDDNPLQRLPCRRCCESSSSSTGGGGGGGSSSSSNTTTRRNCCLFPSLRHLQLAGTQIAEWTSGLDDFFLGCPDCRRAKRATTTTTSCRNDDEDEDAKASRRSILPLPPPLESLRFRSTPLSERLGAAATRVTLIARYGSSYYCTAAATTTTAMTTTTTQAGASSPEPQHQQPLSVINATVVTNAERIQAERRYVTTMCRLLAQQERDAKLELQSNGHCSNNDVDDYEQMKKMQESFWQEHPMLPLLLERHQTAAACANGSSSGTGSVGRVGGTLLADSIISVSLQSMAASSCEKPPLIRRLPLTLTILQVKTMLARHYGLDVDLQQLTFVATTITTTTTTTNAASSNGEHNPRSSSASTTASSSTGAGLLPTIMDDDEATLGYFGVDDGAVIYMHEIDVTERQLQQTRKKDEFDTKLQQQQADWEARLGAEKKEEQ